MTNLSKLEQNYSKSGQLLTIVAYLIQIRATIINQDLLSMRRNKHLVLNTNIKSTLWN